MEENVDYELIPSSDKNDFWNIRILTGEFVETVINFGAIKVAEDGEHLNFDFSVHYSPVGDSADNVDLQSTAGAILLSIIENSIKETDER